MATRLLDTTAAAVYLGGEDRPLKPNTLERWRVYGKGPAWRKVGSRVRYAVEDLDAWLASQTRTSTSQSQPA